MTMSNSGYSANSKQSRTMTEEQFEKIVDAILAGKYSWACVLILQTAGYNPLHYIPYRTYNRLIKDNCLKQSHKKEKNEQRNFQKQQLSKDSCQQTTTQTSREKIKDINYLEELTNNTAKIHGGFRLQLWQF
ncbi:HetP protein [Crocosphaera subtropica ATCC 51142]|uniref:HetP protein n=2 Tax=Crocosphaera TaxID=263510 RepID=B1WTA3_CROS5|nr:HetP protein [Crocosphaera subtropica ATCC 51142]